MALPNIQQAQYGDRVSLDKLAATRKTNNPAVDVQSMTGGAGGRPATTDPVQLAIKNAPQAVAAQQGEEQNRYNAMFGSLATQYATAVKWQRIANQPGAGPYTKSFALAAMREFYRNLMEARQATPFFDGA